jgi:hypothetical protein
LAAIPMAMIALPDQLYIGWTDQYITTKQ